MSKKRKKKSEEYLIKLSKITVILTVINLIIDIIFKLLKIFGAV